LQSLSAAWAGEASAKHASAASHAARGFIRR
jgi:hypothetical protein